MRRLKAKFLAWIEEKHEPTHKFLTREDKPYPTVRSIGSVLLILLVGATLLWGLTGQPLGNAPVVVIESESMMHCEQGFGTEGNACDTSTFLGIGTIDTGDLIFVKAPGTIETMAEGGKKHHGESGDTIVYQPHGSDQFTPIIHRVMFTLEINGDGTYNVPELGLERINDLDHPSIKDADRFDIRPDCRLRLAPYGHASLTPADSGFITKGDNNGCWDQGEGIITVPVREEWVLGKARGEVPWIGVVKLFVFDILQGTDNHAGNAPGNIKAAGWFVVGLIVLGPTAYEMAHKRFGKHDEEGDKPTGSKDEEPAADEEKPSQ
ncbi:MAG: hypothetical protein ACPHK8_03640 [Thermoplasmatota archaeon]